MVTTKDSLKTCAGRVLLLALVLTALDLGVKYWVYLHSALVAASQFDTVDLTAPSPMINQSFTGGSAFNPLMIFTLIFSSCLATAMIIRGHGPLAILSNGLFVAALLGNVPERILTGGVIDYLTFSLPGELYFICNLADLFALASLGLLLFYLYHPTRFGYAGRPPAFLTKHLGPAENAPEA
jgi:lipoprotein signal peptidase